MKRFLRFYSPPARWGLLDFIRAVLPPPPPPPPPPLPPPPVSPRPPASLPPPLHPLPCPLPPCQLFANLFANFCGSGRRWTSTAGFRSEWAQLDINRQVLIAVGTAGPQPGTLRALRQLPCAVGTAGPQLPAADLNGHGWTSTARFWAQWAPLYLNQGDSEPSGHRWTSTGDLQSSVGTAGPQPGTFQAQWAPLDLNGQIECQKICQIERQIECQIECQEVCYIKCQNVCQILPDRTPEDLPDRVPEDMPDRMPDRMPEDLPVTKRNVMVGITRRKVFLFSFFG